MSVTDNPREFIDDLLATGRATLRDSAGITTADMVAARTRLSYALGALETTPPRWTRSLINIVEHVRLASEAVTAASAAARPVARPSRWRRLLGVTRD